MSDHDFKSKETSVVISAADTPRTASDTNEFLLIDLDEALTVGPDVADSKGRDHGHRGRRHHGKH